MEILRLVADEDSTVEDLAAVIEADPVLAARLLGTVNSGLYTLVREIHSIDQAAVLVGFRTIRTLALSVSLSEGVPAAPACPGFDLERYWRHCLMTAVLAKRMATELKKALADDAFSVGLIANIGRLVVARCVPGDYGRVLSVDAWPHSETETAALGYCTAQVSAALLKQWGLPDSLCAAVRWVDEPGRIPEHWNAATVLTAKIVSAADKAVDHLLQATNGPAEVAVEAGGGQPGGESGPEDTDYDAVHAVAGEIAAALDLTMDTAHLVLEEAGQQVGEVQHLVSSNLPSDINPADLIGKAQHLLAEAGV